MAMLSFICRLWKHIFFPPLHALLSFLRDCSEAASLSLSPTHTTLLLHICLSQFSIPNKFLVSSLPLLWVLRLFARSPECDLIQCVSRNTQSDNTQVKCREQTTSHQLQRWNTSRRNTPTQVKITGLFVQLLVYGRAFRHWWAELTQALDQRRSKNHTKLLRCGKTSKASCWAVNGP